LLNSRLLNWLYKRRFTNSSKLTVNLSKEYIGQIPVKIVEQRRQKLVTKIVGEILETKRSDPGSDTSGQERRLDATIYEFYGLTENEIAIVEGRDT